LTSVQPNNANQKSERPFSVGVIGGGPGGLAAAARLAEQGVSVHLFEASSELGGLARSIDLWGQQIELSAHIFRSSDHFVSSLWKECSGESIKIPLRRGIFDGESIVEYPMTPWRILKNIGIVETLQSIVGVCVGRLSNLWKQRPKNAEEWMIRTYGKPLHKKFLRSYAEKLWGVPCAQIHARFPQFLFQSAKDSKGDQSFMYPRKGNSFVWNSLGKKLETSGVVIHTQSRVSKLIIEDGVVTGLMMNDQRIELDHVISTMPLGLLGRLTLGDDANVAKAASILKARSTVLVYLKAPKSSRCEFNWISIYPDEYKIGRVTDFGHWLGSSDDTTIYCLEYWCDRDDELWRREDDDIANLAMNELNKTRLFGEVTVLNSHVLRIPSTHPVFSLESQSAIDTINSGLASIAGLSTVGRHGSHGVLGMGESMEAARHAADCVVSHRGEQVA